MRTVETWIPISDGVRLSAKLWLPDDAETRKVPAILEYLPYRHRDGTWERDALTHPWFAEHGYASLRVDLRGSGESGGLLGDEYSPQEHADALEVIDWIARQEWSSGAVGMMGISWGGFNALQVAALRPPALKAVISLCSTDDRYADDVHYMGGALLSSTFGWAMAFTGIMATPPDPALVGEAWRGMWRERLEAMPLFVERWLRHQRRDEYWRHGSICEDWDAIQCPVFAIGGWTDAYTNTIPRMLANLRVPVRGLIGPWAHRYPHMGMPGPAAGFLQEARDWWDRWLKGAATAPEPPVLRAWMMESVRPAPFHEERPGRWIAEPGWPPARVETRTFHLGRGGRLQAQPDGGAGTAICSPPHLGSRGGNWCPFGLTPDDAEDQREDDALSAVWDSGTLAERVEILGAPVLRAVVSCDRPVANLIVRLCDVHPDGASLRVSYGVLNLTHRDGHEAPAPMEPGKEYNIRLRLNDAGFAFPPGHRIRVAISSAYWPIVWPAPDPATVVIRDARLEMPVRPLSASDPAIDVAPPVTPPSPAKTVLTEGRSVREAGRDIGTGEHFWRSLETPVRSRIDSLGTEVELSSRTEYRIHEDDPLSARMEMERRQLVLRNDVETRVDLRGTLRANREAFIVEVWLEAREGERAVTCRKWRAEVEREVI